MKRIFSTRVGPAVMVIFLANLFLAGCGAKLQEADVAYARPILDNIIEAIRERDYGKFSKDFSEKMKAGLPEKDFDELAAKMDRDLGEYEERNFTSAVRAINPAVDLMIVKYRAKYANDGNVIITIYFSDINGEKRIEGILFDSPSLHE